MTNGANLAQRLRPYTLAGAGRRALRVKLGRTPRLDYRHASRLTYALRHRWL